MRMTERVLMVRISVQWSLLSICSNSSSWFCGLERAICRRSLLVKKTDIPDRNRQTDRCRAGRAEPSIRLSAWMAEIRAAC